MNLTNHEKAVLVLTTRLHDPNRPSLGAAGWHKLRRILGDADMVPGDIFEKSIPGLSAQQNHRIVALLDDASAVLVEASGLSDRGIWCLTSESDSYPYRLMSRLVDNAPPVLFGAGGIALLGQGGIGVVGSRNVEPEGAGVAIEAASIVASNGRPIVSGGARGVDQLAMRAAYQAGGTIVGVLADSLIERIKPVDVLGALDSGSTCLVTMQHPRAGFSPAAAMNRNKVIYGLADSTFVVASDEGSGGTWAGAVEALDRGYGPVSVWRGAGEGVGNAALERRGARRVDSLDAAQLLVDPPPDPPQQLTFG